MQRNFAKTMLTNATPINKNAKILALRLWTKLDSQPPVSDRSTVEETDPIPLYDDPLYRLLTKYVQLSLTASSMRGVYLLYIQTGWYQHTLIQGSS